MKAQRRQELKSNSLVDEIGLIVEYVQSKSQMILVVLVAVAVLLGVTLFWRQAAQNRRVEGWQTLLILLSTDKQKDPQVLDKLEQLAGSYSDQRLKAMAYAQLGNRLVEEATMADSPEAARKLIERAQSAFESVLSQTPDQAYPVAIAQIGLGGLAADRADFDAAKRYYEAVAGSDQLKGSPFPGQASAALTALEMARKLPPLAPGSQPASAAAAPTSQPAKG